MKINDFIGIPYLAGGRDFKGCDCWGLVTLYYREALGLELPDYKISPEDFKIIDKKISGLWGGSGYKRIDRPVENCLVLMRLGNFRGGINHIGIWKGSKILQAYEKTASNLVTASSPLWRPMIKGFALPVLKEKAA